MGINKVQGRMEINVVNISGTQQGKQPQSVHTEPVTEEGG